MVKEIFKVDTEKVGKSKWLYDSGAGEHITNNLKLLKNFKKKNIKLKCANNTYCHFEGHVEFEFTINNHYFKIKRVLYSKDTAKNIVSGIEWAKHGIKTLTEMEDNENVTLRIFDNNYSNFLTCQANKNNEFKITVDHFDENDARNNKNNIIAIQNFRNANELIWHRRLGHFYQEDLKNYLNLNNINESTCDDCKIVKMKRFPHNKTPPRARNYTFRHS